MLIFVIIEGMFFDRFRYYFMNFREFGLGYFIQAVFLLIVVFLFVGTMIIFFNKVYRKKPEQT